MAKTIRALTLSKVNKAWYVEAQRLAYSAITIDDETDWVALATRLASPIYGAIHLRGATVGSYVLRLHVVTTDLTEPVQTYLLRILLLCPSLRCLSISNHDVATNGTLLTINSTFMLGLLDASHPLRHHLRFLSLALHMDASAAQRLMNTIRS